MPAPCLGPVSRTIPGHMSGLITLVAANSCQLPPAVPHNVDLAITPITHDPTTQARLLRRPIITWCGLCSGNYQISQLGIILHHGCRINKKNYRKQQHTTAIIVIIITATLTRGPAYS